MATRIQTRWRGYSSRKFVHDAVVRKRYIQNVLSINAATHEVLERAKEEALAKRQASMEAAKRDAFIRYLKAMHPLLSTANVRGPLSNIKYDSETRSLEDLIREQGRSHLKCIESKTAV